MNEIRKAKKVALDLQHVLTPTKSLTPLFGFTSHLPSGIKGLLHASRGPPLPQRGREVYICNM